MQGIEIVFGRSILERGRDGLVGNAREGLCLGVFNKLVEESLDCYGT